MSGSSNNGRTITILIFSIAVICPPERAYSFSPPPTCRPMRSSRRRRTTLLQARRSAEDPSLQSVYGGYGQYLNARKENKSLYEVLRCSPDATWTQLKRSYIDLAKVTHPDALIASGISPDAVDPAAFEEISHAWTVLSDERERMRYDKRLQAKRITSVFGALVSWAAELVTSFIPLPPPSDAVGSTNQADGPRNIENSEMAEGDGYYSSPPNEQWGGDGDDSSCYQEDDDSTHQTAQLYEMADGDEYFPPDEQWGGDDNYSTNEQQGYDGRVYTQEDHSSPESW